MELVSSTVTYALRDDAEERVSWPRGPAPFAWEERGGYTCALYPGRLLDEPSPGDDVVALLLLPPGDWALLERSPTIAEAERAGMRLVETTPVARETRLWVHPGEALRAVAPLVEAHREVFGA